MKRITAICLLALPGCLTTGCCTLRAIAYHPYGPSTCPTLRQRIEKRWHDCTNCPPDGRTVGADGGDREPSPQGPDGTSATMPPAPPL